METQKTPNATTETAPRPMHNVKFSGGPHNYSILVDGEQIAGNVMSIEITASGGNPGATVTLELWTPEIDVDVEGATVDGLEPEAACRSAALGQWMAHLARVAQRLSASWKFDDDQAQDDTVQIEKAQSALHQHCNGAVSFDHDATAHRGDAEAVVGVAKLAHDTSGCGCDPRYLASCPRFAQAILDAGKKVQP